ncbi:MAG: MnmA/TRMU family protein [Leptospirillia bacterium]
MKKNKKIVIGMSGGVDSAVSAWLLKKDGYDVTGVILRLWGESDSETTKGWGERTCCHVPMVEYLCQKILDIPFAIVDAESTFRSDVVDSFKSAYQTGETPNPCTSCNEKVKLPLLRRWAEKNEIPKVATGHYTYWKRSEDFDVPGLAMAQDLAKDQSYFLSRTPDLSPENTVFPVGQMTKPQVRKMALEAGFPVDGLLENQEVCFVSEKRVTEFLSREIGQDHQVPWNVMTIAGEPLGAIPTAIGLTRGQRKGLSVAGGRRLYVHSVDIPKRQIWLSDRSDLFESTFTIKYPMGVLFEKTGLPPGKLFVRFRSTMSPVACQIDDRETGRFRLEKPHDGIVDGQVAAFYDRENVLVGSGIIIRKGKRSELSMG